MEKSQLAMGTRPTVYSMPRAEKYDASNACCSGAVTFRMFRAAASGGDEGRYSVMGSRLSHG